ncbi:hypothetical protein L1987_07630 [Smallanthus sonchifolius]|uniref:Uncharacterized protein n=1 Tax=Smallanthus sonchifolius TaxID=185202 RepID=A0ACB9K155_9ASTR|nr:hypothetical protein L1987_07630 [Smallanthus sonchifolius]
MSRHLPSLMSKQRHLCEMVPKAEHKLIDTYALVSNLEKEGVPSKQAELLAAATATNECLNNFLLKEEMDREIKLLEEDMSFELEEQISEERLFALKCESEVVHTFVQEYKSKLISRMNVEVAKTAKEANVNLHKVKADLEATKFKFFKLSALVALVAVGTYCSVKLQGTVNIFT